MAQIHNIMIMNR